MKKKLLAIFLISLFIISPVSHLTAQINAGNETETAKAIDQISNYSIGSNIVDDELKNVGFKPPPNLENEWKYYSPVRKIYFAYLSAETHAKGNGENLLALLSKSMAQQYDSAKNDPNLKPFIRPEMPPRVDFKHPQNIPNEISLPPEYKAAIRTIASYVDGGADTLDNILINDFKLTPEKAFEIQATSKNTKEALKRGTAESSESLRRDNIAKVVERLDRIYESARFVKEFDPFRKNKSNPSDYPPGFGFNGEPPPNPNPPNNDGGNPDPSKGGGGKPIPPKTPNGSSGSGNTYNPSSEYNELVKRSYSPQNSTQPSTGSPSSTNAPPSRKFGNMKRSPGGFGGVILGNDFKVDSNLLDLESVTWKPNSDSPVEKYGTLEFNYKNKEQKLYSNVLLEDAYASYEILNGYSDNEFIKYEEGNGVGLASLAYGGNSDLNEAEYVDYNGRLKRKVLLHPTVANLSIGWSLLYVDMAPDLKTSIASKVLNKKERDKVLEVLTYFRNWKVTDTPSIISSSGKELTIHSESDNPELFFEMNIPENRNQTSSDADSAGKKFLEIRNILYKNNYHYKRVNDFIKTFFIFRYIKQRKASVTSLPKEYKDKKIHPHFIGFGTDGKEFFETPLEEGKNWRNKVNSQISEIKRVINSSSIIDPTDKTYLIDYIKKVESNGKINDETWKQIDNYYYKGGGTGDLCKGNKISPLLEQINEARALSKIFPLEEEINQVNALLAKETDPAARLLLLSKINEILLSKGVLLGNLEEGSLWTIKNGICKTSISNQ